MVLRQLIDIGVFLGYSNSYNPTTYDNKYDAATTTRTATRSESQ
jgi:hypothetical protein